MRSIVLALGLALLGLSTASHAATFKRLSAPHSPALAALYATLKQIGPEYTGAFAVTVKTAARGRSDQELQLAMLKESMHRFMCDKFDESIDLTLRSERKAVEKVVSDLDFSRNSEATDEQVQKFERQLALVLSKRELQVYSGNASGNNTSGSVMGVYDTQADEVVFFGFTNCGSDS